MASFSARKVAIVHDWLNVYGGAERTLACMLELFPHADLFSMVDFLTQEDRARLQGKYAKTSFVQKLPFAKSHYRAYLPLMPFAVEQLDLRGYDLVLSSSHAVAKGVLTGPDQLHLCYCYSPMRYAWDLTFQYLEESGLEHGPKSWLARWLLHRLRLWDVRSANGVDQFIGISHYIARRIRKCYRREAAVLYPPVDTEFFSPDETAERGDFYVTASRMVPYKRIDLIVSAFKQLPDCKLVVIGSGPEEAKIRKLAGPNIRFLGAVPGLELRAQLRRAKAFVFAAEEDFGIAPLEAQACGTPVIALGKGAALETIRGLEHASPSGLFFDEQNEASLIAAIRRFESNPATFAQDACVANAARFSAHRFQSELAAFVAEQLEQFALRR